MRRVLKTLDPQDAKNRDIEYLRQHVLGLCEQMRDQIVEEMENTDNGGDAVQIPYSLIDEWTDGFDSSKIIGEGSFGIVYEGVYNDSQGRVYGRCAVKKVSMKTHLDSCRLRSNVLAYCKKELQVSRLFRSNPFIVKLKGFYFPIGDDLAVSPTEEVRHGRVIPRE